MEIAKEIEIERKKREISNGSEIKGMEAHRNRSITHNTNTSRADVCADVGEARCRERVSRECTQPDRDVGAPQEP